MATLKKLKREQILQAIRDSEFGNDVISAGQHVAVILSQDWCPQWKMLHDQVKEMHDHPDLVIWYLEYNTCDQYEEFLSLKEDRWNNRAIPYVRYYTDGKFKCDSNYVAPEKFAALCGLPRK